LVRRQVAVIVATGGSPTSLAAKAATATIPIVFRVGLDPIAVGLVASLNRPGGNVTGVCGLTNEVGPKRLQLLHEMSYAAVSVTITDVGIYIGRVLKGEKPADLPVQQATRIELIVNMKTAKALGLTFPLTILGRADEVADLHHPGANHRKSSAPENTRR
jgi:ABC-type uncharacterized transport system substrate-binding protein